MTLAELEQKLWYMARSSTCNVEPTEAAEMLTALREQQASFKKPEAQRSKRGDTDMHKLRVEDHADKLYAALKAYYHECRCRRAAMDEVNQRAYAALTAYEKWSGR
jgi:hypothetical protein